jgi:hypothetical protein
MSGKLALLPKNASPITSGYKHSPYVQRFGLELLYELFADIEPMTWAGSKNKERELAAALREQGYGVWTN